MARKKDTNGLDVAAASTKSLTDFGGAADRLIKKTGTTLEAIKVELRERAGNLENDMELTEAGEDFTMTVGKVPNMTVIEDLGNVELIEMVGQEAFNLLAKFPTGLLKEYLSKKDFDNISKVEDGTRKVAFKERNGN